MIGGMARRAQSSGTMTMKNGSVSLLLALLIAGPVLANDTMAEMKTGGLSYLQSPDIAMEQEDLFISPTEVRVDYVFHNTSDKDVEGVVAFPMPEITGGPDGDMALDDRESDNFLGFSVSQDGKPITPTLQQRVTAIGVDWTEVLLAAKVPMMPYSEKTIAALKFLPEDLQKQWLSRGLVYIDSYDAGKGWQNDLTPLWTLHSTYWWTTKFPAGERVKVSHRYRPSVGGTVAMTFVADGKPTDTAAVYRQRYCTDDDFLKAAARLEKAANAGSGPNYTESWISYILTTGANWNGGIGRFTLTVDKGNPKNLVSFCGKDVKKIGPTTFQMKADDFSPQRDLDILILNAGE